MSDNDCDSPSNRQDANDYSRFDDISDEESAADTSDTQTEPQHNFHDSLSMAIDMKESGNISFKKSDLKAAKDQYESAIKLLNPHKSITPPTDTVTMEKFQEMKTLLVSLHGNLAMVMVKEENWSGVISSSNEVLKSDPDNIKALYRRSVALHRTGSLEESKAGLNRILALESTNNAAKKELIEVMKALKEQKQREKAAMSNMFAKGNMYEDKEAERQAKLRREREEEERLQDEWVQDKLKRRKEGDDTEISFEDWKKARKEAQEKEKKEREKAEKAKRKESIPKPIKRAPKQEENDDEYDEEDSKIISETTSKGYCYFKRQLPTEESKLIGDITPKAVGASEATSTSAPIASSDNASSVGASSWNSAGTWEERDTTQFVKDRLRDMCAGASVSLPGDMGSPDAISDALKSIGAHSDKDDAMASIQNMASSLAAMQGRVSEVKTINGDAQIILTRGKKRHLYDFNITLKIEIVVDDISGEASKKKTYKGELVLTDVVPGSPIENQLTFKKAVPDRVRKCAEDLKAEIFSRIRAFDSEYRNM